MEQQNLPVEDVLDGRGLDTDILILIMGQTKSGKSTLINQLVGQQYMLVGSSLNSTTLRPEGVAISRAPNDFVRLDQALEGGRRRIVLVDTPGFDDTHMKDDVVLISITKWLATSYRAGMRVGGILYLHDITDSRWGGTSRRNLEIFRKLCGSDAMNKVAFLTTKWEKLKEPQDGIARAKELVADQWSEQIAGGGAAVHHLWPSYDTATTPEIALPGIVSSAWHVIQDLAFPSDAAGPAERDSNVGIQIQQELVDRKLFLTETEAGKEVCLSLRDLVKQAKEVGKSAEAGGTAAARQRQEEAAKEIAQLVDQLKNIEPKLTQRVKRWLGRLWPGSAVDGGR